MKVISLQKICLWGGLLLSACLFAPDKVSRGSVVDNEVVGLLYHTDGSVAVNARVRVYPVDHVPDSSTAAYITVTDASGRYVIDSLPNGEYNVLGDLNGEYSLLDSILFTSQTDTLPPDTLDAPGSMAGIVGLQPGHNPVTVTVQVLGTDNYANVDAGGHFQLSNLARGQYRLRLSTTLLEYTPLYTPMTIRAARSDTFPDTLWLPYTGIPVVTGLRATYDTLRGIVHLSWDSVNYANFERYLVYRDPANAATLSQQPIGLSAIASLDDSLLLPSQTGLFSIGDTVDRRLEYRIKVRNLSSQIGLNYGFLPVLAEAPAKVKTLITFRIPQITWDSSYQVDSTVVVADLRNTLRGLTQVAWALGRSDSIVDSSALSGNSLTDTLRFGWPNQGSYMVYVRVRDTAGLYWNDSLMIPGNSAPSIGGSPTTYVKTGREFLFTPTASDPDGDALRFSAANLPAWLTLNTSTGELRGTPINAQIGTDSGIVLRVSDGRRITVLPPFDLAVRADPWTIKQTITPQQVNREARGVTELGGKIYVGIRTYFGIVWDSMFVYNPAADTWSTGISVPELPYGKSFIQTVNGEIFVFSNDSVLVYDTAAQTLGTRNSLPPGNTNRSYASSGGKIYQITRDAITEYDPLLNVWNTKQTPPFQSRGLYPTSVAVAANKIHVIGQVGGSASGLFLVYDPALDTWSDGPQISNPLDAQSLCAGGGKIYLMGGFSSTSMSDRYRVEALDPITGIWVLKSPALRGGNFGPCAEFGGKMYVFGTSDPGPTFEVQQYDPLVDQ